MSTKSTMFHQWDEGFSKADARLTRPLFSLCFKDMASQIASEFLSKSRRVQLDLAISRYVSEKQKTKTKQNTV